MRVRRIKSEGKGKGQLHKLLASLQTEGKVAYSFMCPVLDPLDFELGSLKNQVRGADTFIIDGLDQLEPERREEVMFRVMQLAATFDKHPDIFVLI